MLRHSRPRGRIGMVATLVATLRLDKEQRTLQIGKIAGIQDLNTGVVLTVERGHIGRTTGVARIDRRVEPEAEMEGVNGIRHRIRARIRKCGVVHESASTKPFTAVARRRRSRKKSQRSLKP